MRNLKPIILILVLSFTISACQTIKNKTDEIVEKENQKLTKYIGKTSGLLKMELGAPSEDFKNENCLLYTSPSPRDLARSRMPSSA